MKIMQVSGHILSTSTFLMVKLLGPHECHFLMTHLPYLSVTSLTKSWEDNMCIGQRTSSNPSHYPVLTVNELVLLW